MVLSIAAVYECIVFDVIFLRLALVCNITRIVSNATAHVIVCSFLVDHRRARYSAWVDTPRPL